jgi:hypothetical protein
MAHQQALEHRVAELERRASRYRNALTLLIVGICTVAVVGATTDDGVIEGRRLVLSDGEDRPYAMIARTESSSGLTIFSPVGEVVAMIGTALTGDGILMVGSKDGKGRTGIYSDERGFVFSGANRTGEEVVQIRADVDGDGLLMIKSKTGTDRIYIGASAVDDTGFWIQGYNKTGERVVQLSADEYGNGVVGAYNRKGEGRTLKPGP